MHKCVLLYAGAYYVLPRSFLQIRYRFDHSGQARRQERYHARAWAHQTHFYFEGFPARQMPMVLPHDLVSAMAKAGLWPSQIGKAESVRDWWEHNAKKNNWYCNHPAFTDQKHEPLCLYGDDACLTKAGNEKMVCITLSHCLDTRSDSLVTSWPLCLFRCVS